MLCDEGHALCDLAVREREQILAVDAAAAAVGRENAVDALEQRALADAVVAEHGQKVAAVKLKAHVAQDRASALVVIAEVVDLDHV